MHVGGLHSDGRAAYHYYKALQWPACTARLHVINKPPIINFEQLIFISDNDLKLRFYHRGCQNRRRNGSVYNYVLCTRTINCIPSMFDILR